MFKNLQPKLPSLGLGAYNQWLGIEVSSRLKLWPLLGLNVHHLN